MTWHERLEIFCPLTGRGTFRIGEHIESFEAGDILLIDNLRLHGVNSFEGLRRHALVIVFTPDLLAAPGALPCDLWLLRPFHHLEHRCLHLPWEGEHSGAAWDCLTRLLLEELDGTTGPVRQVRLKLALAELLIVLQQAFQDRIAEHNEYESRRERLRRLTPLFDMLAGHLDTAPGVPDAARFLGMSPSYFMRYFRTAAGLTYSAYVDHLRLTRAYHLLIESDASLAQIAAETGYCASATSAGTFVAASGHPRAAFAPPGTTRSARWREPEAIRFRFTRSGATSPEVAAPLRRNRAT